MILFQNERVGCEQCIRGHRAADCHHLNKPLVTIKGRGKTGDKKFGIRLRLADCPEVVEISEREIDIKNGRSKENCTFRKCFIVDPNTLCCFYKVSVKDRFSLCEPVELDDPYYNTYKINIQDSQQINIIPGNDPCFRIGNQDVYNKSFEKSRSGKTETPMKKETPQTPKRLPPMLPQISSSQTVLKSPQSIFQSISPNQTYEPIPVNFFHSSSGSSIQNDKFHRLRSPTISPDSKGDSAAFSSPSSIFSNNYSNGRRLSDGSNTSYQACGCNGPIICPSHIHLITQGMHDESGNIETVNTGIIPNDPMINTGYQQEAEVSDHFLYHLLTEYNETGTVDEFQFDNGVNKLNVVNDGPNQQVVEDPSFFHQTSEFNTPDVFNFDLVDNPGFEHALNDALSSV